MGKLLVYISPDSFSGIRVDRLGLESFKETLAEKIRGCLTSQGLAGLSVEIVPRNFGSTQIRVDHLPGEPHGAEPDEEELMSTIQQCAHRFFGSTG